MRPWATWRSLKNLLEKRGESYDAYMADPPLEQYHFIGKDIASPSTPCSGPPCCTSAAARRPTSVIVHGFITVNNGEKMSKSRGTGLDPLKYLRLGMNPEWLRYYLAAKLNSRNEDVDFNAGRLHAARVNSRFDRQVHQHRHRAAGFLTKRFDGQLAAISPDWRAPCSISCRPPRRAIAELYADREYGKAIREVMALADRVNDYVDANKPWELAKKDGMEARLQDVCTTCVEALQRVLDRLAQARAAGAGRQRRGLPAMRAAGLRQRSTPRGRGRNGQAIGNYQHLMQRVDTQAARSLVRAAAPRPNRKVAVPGGEEIAPTISIDDFAKIDLRIALHRELRAGRGLHQAAAPDAGCRARARTRNVFPASPARTSPRT